MKSKGNGGVYWKVLYSLFYHEYFETETRKKKKRKKYILTFLGQDTEEAREELGSRVMNI